MDVTEDILKIMGDVVKKATLRGTSEYTQPRIEEDYMHEYDFPFEGILTVEFINGKKVEFEHSEFGWLNKVE